MAVALGHAGRLPFFRSAGLVAPRTKSKSTRIDEAAQPCLRHPLGSREHVRIGDAGSTSASAVLLCLAGATHRQCTYKRRRSVALAAQILERGDPTDQGMPQGEVKDKLAQTFGGASAIDPNIQDYLAPTTDPALIFCVEGDLVFARNGLKLNTNSKPGAIVKFSGGGEGVVLAWKEGIAVIQASECEPGLGEEVIEQDMGRLTRASTAFCGRILDSRGFPLDGRPMPPVPVSNRMTIEAYKTSFERTNQYDPCFTGVLGIDFTCPIGRGQTMLFQGANEEQDIANLWPDLMCAPLLRESEGPSCRICVCKDLDAAVRLQEALKTRGVWEESAIIVPTGPGVGAGMLAMHAAMALAEEFSEEFGDAVVVMEFWPMMQVWLQLANVAGEERASRGLSIDPEDENWVEMEGTIMQESISERRGFWFSLVSRANNAKHGGTVTLLPWLWEQQGGLKIRQKQAFLAKLTQVQEIPRIDDDVRERLVRKVKENAAAEGIHLDEDQEDSIAHDIGTPGVPNFEIEELKSITDGHVILKPSGDDGPYMWKIDPYKSIPRIGTDALHKALISMEAHKLRLKMFQGRDLYEMKGETLGPSGMLDTKERLELRYVELMLEQPAGEILTVAEEVARFAIAGWERIDALEGSQCNSETLAQLSRKLLETDVGQQIAAKIETTDARVTPEERLELLAEVKKLAGDA